MILSQFSDPLDIKTVAVRLALSFVLSFLIGFEREKSRQPAGLRTHILICLGSTLFMILSMSIPAILKGKFTSDPTRIAAQIVTGIGFLGAGAILKSGINVKGLTTAANIWVISAVGIAVGAGFYSAAFIAAGLTLFTLIVLDKLEKLFIKNKTSKLLVTQFKSGSAKLNQIIDILQRHNIGIVNIDISESKKKNLTEYRFSIEIPERYEINLLFQEVRAVDELIKIDLNER